MNQRAIPAFTIVVLLMRVPISTAQDDKAAKPGFPRVANLWGSGRFIPKGMAYASRIDLGLGAHFTAEQIRELRRLNPNCFILTSINTVENNNVPDEYFLRDTTGRKIEVWPGAYRLNLTRPEVARDSTRFKPGGRRRPRGRCTARPLG